MIHKQLVVLVICFVGTSSPLAAQEADVRFHHITIEDGLSQSTIQTIFQDQEGYMWFGTQDGLNKYDGYDITIYRHDPEDSTSISNDDIRVIYEDKQGNLWMGTQVRGLNRYDRGKDRFIRYVGRPTEEAWQTLSSNTVWSLLEDSHGNFWVGTSYGLNLMNREEGTFQRIFAEEEDPTTLTHNHISKIYEDRDGTLWIGTAEGLNRLNRGDGTFKHYLAAPDENRELSSVTESASDHFIRSIYEDRQGTLWVGTEEQGLYYLNRDEDSFQFYQSEFGSESDKKVNAVYSILEDSDGNLWIGTGNEGLHILNREQGRFYSYRYQPEDPYSLNNNGINSLYESSDRILWVGTYAGGVNFRDSKTDVFRHFRNDPLDPTSLSNNSVQSFIEDDNGNIWIGTDGGGLNLFDPETGEFEHFQSDPDDQNTLSNDVILDMAETEEGLWLGTYSGGVSLFDVSSQTFRQYRHDQDDPSSLSSDYVFKILKSRDGLLWFGTNWGGISILNPESGEFTRYESDFEHPDDSSTVDNNDIREIYEDRNGIIWIGSYGERLTRFDRDRSHFSFFDINMDERYYSSVIQSIVEDSHERLWLGTRGGGLKLFDRSTHEVNSYTIQDGLPSNIIHAIVIDDEGLFWLSTNNGISRFDPDTENFQNYGLEVGLQSNEFNPRSAYQDSQGYIYFGGVNGFNRFHPDNIQPDTISYPVILTDFLIFNKPVSIGEDSPLKNHISQTDQLVLSHEASVITFGYSALNFSKEKRNDFAFKLDGFEEDWNYVGDQRRATYTNLDPGEYTFRVMVPKRDGVWNEAGASLGLVIIPPFWQTAWFTAVMILGLAGLVFLIFHLRVKSIRRQNKRLARIISERTSELKKANATKDKLFSIIAHDLNNVAAGIVGLSEILKKSVEERNLHEIETYTGYLHQTSEQFSTMLKNLLNWARAQTGQIECKPRRFRIKQLVDTVLSQEKPRAVSKKIELSSSVDPELRVFADPDMIVVVVRNLVHNALKFTDKDGGVNIGATSRNEYVEISVSDNGMGMDEDTIQKILANGEHVSSKQGTLREKGTGIGLPLCRDFIRMNKGDIKIESKLGRGTTISFTLPHRKLSDSIPEGNRKSAQDVQHV